MGNPSVTRSFGGSKKQIERMKSGSCNAEAGILFSELLTDFERIGDHVLNIAEQYQNMAR